MSTMTAAEQHNTTYQDLPCLEHLDCQKVEILYDRNLTPSSCTSSGMSGERRIAFPATMPITASIRRQGTSSGCRLRAFCDGR